MIDTPPTGEPSKCPYLEICKSDCPGLHPDKESWTPVKGFIRKEDGVLCLDWNVLVPFSSFDELRTPEGRHIADSIEAADKIDRSRRKWSRSPKRKKAQRKYLDTDKGQATVDRFQNTEKFKLARQKYYHSEKGQKAHKKRRDTVKGFREAEKWLKEHPGKTFNDFFREQGEQQ